MIEGSWVCATLRRRTGGRKGGSLAAKERVWVRAGGVGAREGAVAAQKLWSQGSKRGRAVEKPVGGHYH